MKSEICENINPFEIDMPQDDESKEIQRMILESLENRIDTNVWKAWRNKNKDKCKCGKWKSKRSKQCRDCRKKGGWHSTRLK